MKIGATGRATAATSSIPRRIRRRSSICGRSHSPTASRFRCCKAPSMRCTGRSHRRSVDCLCLGRVGDVGGLCPGVPRRGCEAHDLGAAAPNRSGSAMAGVYYLAPDGTLMAVPVASERVLDAGRPLPLFQARIPSDIITFRNHYAPSADGQRFLIDSADDHDQSISSSTGRRC